MAHFLVEDFAVGAGARVPEMPAPGSSADAAIDVDDFVPPPRPVRRREAPRALTPPLANVPREPIVLSDSDDDGFDPEAAHDEIMFGAAAEPGPSRPRRPQHPRPQRRALFSPPPPAPQAGPPPPPVPAIPERLRNLRTSLHNLFMHPLEELGELALPLPRPFGGGGLFQHVPHLPAPNPFPPAPGVEQRAPNLGLGGYILRQAAQNFGRGGRNIRFTFDFGLGPGAAAVDADGWQRYDEALFERIDRAAAGPPPPQYKREFLFKDPLPPGFTADFAPPDPSPAPKVFDVETGEEVVDKGKRKADAPQRLLVCAKCADPLRAAQSARERRVWALRCGHVLDGRCLAAVAEDADLAAAHTTTAPAPTPLESAAGPARTVKQTARRGKGRGAVRGRKPPPPPEPETLVLAEREWACPVPRCGKAHWSQLVRKGEHGAPTWVPKPGCGAIQVFA